MTSKREEFEGLLDDLLGASFDQDWSAEKKARAAVLAAYDAGREGQPRAWLCTREGKATVIVRDQRRAREWELVGYDIRPLFTHPATKAVAANWTDADLCRMWKAAGGSFHGPHIETGTMPESKLLPFLRSLAAPPARVGEGERDAEKMEDALEKIRQWAQAYPLTVFPEPDFTKAHELLKAGGMTLDAISASNMRHVITQVQKIVDAAMSREAQ